MPRTIARHGFRCIRHPTKPFRTRQKQDRIFRPHRPVDAPSFYFAPLDVNASGMVGLRQLTGQEVSHRLYLVVGKHDPILSAATAGAKRSA
jgi:hypothetical protein